MSILRHASSVVLVALLAGCASNAADDSDDSTSAVSAAPAQDVSWHYTDMIGHFIENETTVAGTVALTVGGDDLPLAGTTNTLRVFDITVRVPTFADPTKLVNRSFLTRLESRDGGLTYRTLAATGYDEGKSSVVDTALPNAQALFDATYDAATQTARPKDVSTSGGVSFKATKQADGTFKAWAALSIYEERNYARHTTTIVSR